MSFHNRNTLSEQNNPTRAASGVSGVLEMARVMASHRFDATIIFMAVAGEEQGLFGSTHFVQQAKKQHLDVAGMLDNNIIGTSNGDNPHSIRLFSEGLPSDETPTEAAIRRAVGGENDSPARHWPGSPSPSARTTPPT